METATKAEPRALSHFKLSRVEGNLVDSKFPQKQS